MPTEFADGAHGCTQQHCWSSRDCHIPESGNSCLHVGNNEGQAMELAMHLPVLQSELDLRDVDELPAGRHDVQVHERLLDVVVRDQLLDRWSMRLM